MATLKKSKSPSLALVVWANIQKWTMIRGIDDAEIAALLGVKRLDFRKRSRLLDIAEMEKLCAYLAVEPEKLLER
jgi:hypothetical protein